jgi:hypothetical protein
LHHGIKYSAGIEISHLPKRGISQGLGQIFATPNDVQKNLYAAPLSFHQTYRQDAYFDFIYQPVYLKKCHYLNSGQTVHKIRQDLSPKNNIAKLK